MISMTAYWLQFQECLDTLIGPTEDTEYSRQIATAKELIKTGLTIEQLGLLEIQKVSDQLYENTKLFQHQVTYFYNNQDHTFYLPKIVSNHNFLFAIAYYQHLTNYQQVSYQGEIYWFRQKVVDAINQKKVRTAIQAQALLQEIRHYYQSQHITINEALFLKTEHESIKDYTLRLVKTFNKPAEDPKDELKIQPPSPSNEIEMLEQSLERLKQEWNALKTKFEVMNQKLNAFNQARSNYFRLNNEWKNKWFFIKAFYRFLSLFVAVDELKNLTKAHVSLIQTKKDLTEELKRTSPKTYCSQLQQKMRRLSDQQRNIKQEIHLRKKLEQKLPSPQTTLKQSIARVQQEQPMASMATTAPMDNGVDLDGLNPRATPMQHLESGIMQKEQPHAIKSTNPTTSSAESKKTVYEDYYAFFKQNLPSRYTLQAIAVAAAAVAMQHVLS